MTIQNLWILCHLQLKFLTSYYIAYTCRYMCRDISVLKPAVFPSSHLWFTVYASSLTRRLIMISYFFKITYHKELMFGQFVGPSLKLSKVKKLPLNEYRAADKTLLDQQTLFSWAEIWDGSVHLGHYPAHPRSLRRCGPLRDRQAVLNCLWPEPSAKYMIFDLVAAVLSTFSTYSDPLGVNLYPVMPAL